jgi:hypothetical protein
MPLRYPALAGSLVVSLPLLLGSIVPSAAQGYGGAYSAPDDAYHPPQQPAYGAPYPPAAPGGYTQAQAPVPYGQTYSPPPRQTYGEPYPAAPGAGSPYPPSAYNVPSYGSPGPYGGPYGPPAPPPYRDEGFSSNEILEAGHKFFGFVSKGMAKVIEYAFQKQGRPNGYILGQEAGGAFVAGLRYGEGTLYTRDAGIRRVYWQGPSIGYDAGAEGSKVMVLVYNLRDPEDIYRRFGGVDGSAYFVGGVGVTFEKNGHIVVAPIRAGVGFRLGANVGYLKYTRTPTWNPF